MIMWLQLETQFQIYQMIVNNHYRYALSYGRPVTKGLRMQCRKRRVDINNNISFIYVPIHTSCGREKNVLDV